MLGPVLLDNAPDRRLEQSWRFVQKLWKSSEHLLVQEIWKAFQICSLEFTSSPDLLYWRTFSLKSKTEVWRRRLTRGGAHWQTYQIDDWSPCQCSRPYKSEHWLRGIDFIPLHAFMQKVYTRVKVVGQKVTSHIKVTFSLYFMPCF